MTQTQTVEFSAPVVVAGREVTSLTLRPPTAGELRGIKLLDLVQLDIGAVLDVLPRISDLTAAEAARLAPRELMAVATVLVDFFGDGAPAGSGSPET